MKVRQGAAPAGRPESMLPARARVCLLAPHAWPVFSRDPDIQEVGGAEVQQSILARLFAGAGYGVSMICRDYGQPDRVRLDGVTVLKTFREDEGIPVLRFLHPRLTSMWRVLREADADIYYCRTSSMWVAVVAEFCRRHGRRAIYAGASDRDFVPGQAGQIRFARDRWLFRRGLERVDAIVAQNELQVAQCREYVGREAVVIPSCYVLPEERSVAENRDEVLWVGTHHRNKRAGLLLELARRLPHRRFVMIGGPSIEGRAAYDAAQAEAARLPNVEFAGFLPIAQVERRFDRARILVNTSEYEGMPNTFLQAWARGVPTVATVKVQGSPNKACAGLDELAIEVEKLFDARAWAAASGASLEYFRRHHSEAEVLKRYAEVFGHLLRAGKPGNGYDRTHCEKAR